MATVIDAFVATLGLDSESFKKGMEEADEKGKDTFKELAVSALEFFGILATAGAMVEFVKSTLEAEVTAGRLAKTLGIDVEELEALEGAVKRVGGTSEGLDASLKGLNSRLELIAIHGRGAKMSLQVFAGLGISEAALKGKDAIGVLGLLADKMHGMSEARAQGLGQRLGLDEGTIRLLTQGRDGMAALVEHVKSLGVASKEQGEQADKLEQSMKDFNQSMATTGREILSAFLPAILGIGKALASISKWMAEHLDAVVAGIIAISVAFLTVKASAIAMGISAAAAWIAATWPLLLIAALIAAVAAGIYLLIERFGGFNQVAYNVAFAFLKSFFIVEHAAVKMWNGIKDAAAGPLEWIWGKLKSIIDVFRQEAGFFGNLATGNVKGAIGNLGAMVGDVSSLTGMSVRPSVTNSRSTSTSSRQTSIGTINVHTQATDAQGIAKALPAAISSTGLVDQADGGI